MIPNLKILNGLILVYSLLFTKVIFAFIPNASMILQRTAENSGKGIYQIEQEIQFATETEPLIVKETWFIENENNMVLIVSGLKELKDQLQFQAIYFNGQKSLNGQQKKINSEFIERYFHFRSSQNLAQALISIQVAPNHVLAKKPIRSLKESTYQAQDFIRLSRVSGVITYAFGVPANSTQEKPGFWIEQDQFLVRKFRLPTQVQVTANGYSTYPRGLQFPASRSIEWGNHQATIQTTSVKSVTKQAMQDAMKKTIPFKMNLEKNAAAEMINSFYQRLR